MSKETFILLLIAFGLSVNIQMYAGGASIDGDFAPMELDFLHQAAGGGLLPNTSRIFTQSTDRAVFDYAALIIAVKSGQVEIVRLLLQGNIDRNATNRWGKTALHIAVENGPVEIVRLLLQGNIDPNVRDNEGKTGLDLAVNNVEVKIIRELLKDHRVDCNQTLNVSEILDYLVHHGNWDVEMIHVLLLLFSMMDETVVTDMSKKFAKLFIVVMNGLIHRGHELILELFIQDMVHWLNNHTVEEKSIYFEKLSKMFHGLVRDLGYLENNLQRSKCKNSEMILTSIQAGLKSLNTALY